jgi:hypothetical protein
MDGLSAAELIAVWEHGRGQRPVERALTLLAAAHGGEETAAVAELTVGRRDADLLSLREATFGPRLDCLGACPACGERLESSFETEAIRAKPAGEPDSRISVTVDGSELNFRLPTTADLLAVAGAPDGEVARHWLLERCLLGRPTVTAQAAAAVAARMAEAEPQADVELLLSCPSCEHEWKLAFDVAAFFWDEIDARAIRLLRDVHSLAGAYGWSEAEILSLSPDRRSAYLELVAG